MVGQFKYLFFCDQDEKHFNFAKFHQNQEGGLNGLD